MKIAYNFLLLICLTLSCSAADRRVCPIPEPREDILHDLILQHRDLRSELVTAYDALKDAYTKQEKESRLPYLYEHGVLHPEPAVELFNHLIQNKPALKAATLLFLAHEESEPASLEHSTNVMRECLDEEKKLFSRDSTLVNQLPDLIHQRLFEEPYLQKIATYLLCAGTIGACGISTPSRATASICILGSCYAGARKAGLIESLVGENSKPTPKIPEALISRKPKSHFFGLFD